MTRSSARSRTGRRRGPTTRPWRLAAIVGLVCATLGLGLMGSGAADARPQPSPTPTGQAKIAMDLEVLRFHVRGNRIVARGVVTARVTDPAGAKALKQKRVGLRVTAGSSCRIVRLRLDDLMLFTLGLRLETSAINLEITGNRNRSLGKVFCRLSAGLRLDDPAVTKRSARSLNLHLRDRPMRVLGLRAPLVAQQGAPAGESPQSLAQEGGQSAACPVLVVTLGPLELDLLGLRIDLHGETRRKPVRVTALADPELGVLGRVLCRLARGQAV